MKILLAVDGSRYSHEAIDFLSRFPFPAPPEIRLIHVCPVPDYIYTELGIPVDMSNVVELSRKDGEKVLEQAELKCQPWAKSVTKELLLDAVAGQAIVKYATQHHVDLIVAGARGMGAVERFLIGSVSDSITKHAPCSVLIVRPEKGAASPRPWKILIADDGSGESAQAIRRLSALPFSPESQIRLMTVVNTFHAFHAEHTLQQGPELTQLLQKTQERLDRGAALLKGTSADVQTLIKESFEPANRILDQAEEWKPNLIVVGSTGKSAWKRAFLGSVSTRVLHHSVCSVWIERGTPAPGA